MVILLNCFYFCFFKSCTMKIVSILAAIVRERETSFSNFQDFFFQATFKIVYTSLMFSKRKKKGWIRCTAVWWQWGYSLGKCKIRCYKAKRLKMLLKSFAPFMQQNINSTAFLQLCSLLKALPDVCVSQVTYFLCLSVYLNQMSVS